MLILNLLSLPHPNRLVHRLTLNVKVYGSPWLLLLLQRPVFVYLRHSILGALCNDEFLVAKPRHPVHLLVGVDGNDLIKTL